MYAGRSLLGRAKAVLGPRPEAGTAGLCEAAVEEELCRSVVELVGGHRPDDAELVDDLGEVA